MKNLFKVSALLAVAVLTLSGCNCFKKMAKNQDEVNLTVTPEVLVLNNGRVEADINVTFPEKYFNAKAVLKVTPVMVFEGGEVAGTTQYFQGSKVDDNYTVIDKKMGGNYTMHVSFPYDERMACSELQLRAEIKCPKGKCKEFTLVNLNNGAIPTKEEAAILANGGAEADALKRAFGLTIAEGVNTLQNDIDYAAAMQAMESGYKNVTTEVTKANYMYAINSSYLSNKAKKSDELTAFQQKAEAQKSNDRIKQNIYVNGYASPDGPEKFNDKLSAARSESGKKAAEELLAEMGLALDAASYGEDWEGFKELVAASDIEDKEVILSVLGSYKSSADRELQIKNISTVYSELADEVLPKLRRARVTWNYQIIGRSDDEILAQYAADPGKLSLEEILYSSILTEDEAEQTDIFNTAIKLYPNDYRAYNNLGVMAYNKGDYSTAASYFAKAESVAKAAPEVMVNMGYLELLEGNVAEAEGCMTKGADAKAGDEALGNLYIAQGEYGRAAALLKGSKTNSALLAQVLNKNYVAARETLEEMENPNAMTYYIKAVLGARISNVSFVYDGLKKAVELDPSLAKKAMEDLEFAKYVKDATFCEILK